MPLAADLLRAHVAAFNAARPDYVRATALLEAGLRALVAPLAPGVELCSRTKTLASFAGKLLRKPGQYRDPLVEMTDLGGARLVCAFTRDADILAEVVRDRFGAAIDEANSLDQRSRLRAGEFGYRSIHFVVRLDAAASHPQRPGEPLWPGLPAALHGRRLEIQIRTRLQDVWSSLTQRLVYKNPQPLPDSIRREVARIAAEFESLDTDMERIVAEVADYQGRAGPALDDEQLAGELQLQAALREFDPANPAVPLRQAELALARDDWPAAIAAVRSFATAGSPLPPALESILGHALHRQAGTSGNDSDRATALALLRRATERDPADPLAWQRRAAAEPAAATALDCHRRAYRLAPADPACVFSYLCSHLAAAGDLGVVDLLRPTLQAALARSERQAALRLDLPGAHLHAGWFRLLLAEPAAITSGAGSRNRRAESRLDAALRDLLLGLAAARPLSPAREILAAVDLLLRLAPGRGDLVIARELIQLVLARGISTGTDAPAAPDTAGVPLPRRGPPESIFLVAGSARPESGEDLALYRRWLDANLGHAPALVLSGGTAQGVPRLVGELARASGGRLVAIGYVPARLRPDSRSSLSADYAEIRRTDGAHFSPLEPLRAWRDLLASGVTPADVTLLGLGGGMIAAFEYRLALTLGARVRLAGGSGREAACLAQDSDWAAPRWPVSIIPLESAAG